MAALGRRCGRRAPGGRGRSRRCRDPDRAGKCGRDRSVDGDLPRASGLRRARRPARRRLRKYSPYPVSRVSWTDATLGKLYRAERNDGEALAQERCIACHTVEGNTADPTMPRNAGQSRFAIYKQLHDYKSGARVSDIMTPLVGRSERQTNRRSGGLLREARPRGDRPGAGRPRPMSGSRSKIWSRKATSPAVSRPASPVTASAPAARSRRRRSPASTRNISKPSLPPSRMASVTTTSVIACAASPRG